MVQYFTKRKLKFMKLESMWSGVRFARIGITSKIIQAFDQDKGRRYLVNELSRIPGLAGKFGQILAQRFGKPEWDLITAEPMPLEWIKLQIETHAPALASQIDEIDSEALVASIGQVHRARLKDGTEVAIKVRYQGVVEALNDQLELILASFDQMPKAIRRHMPVEEYRAFLREFFNEELNYLKEGASQLKFRDAWLDQKKIIIPNVFLELSTAEILVQHYEPALSLKLLKNESSAIKQSCARQLSQFFLKGLFESGWVHTDLHPKNWGFRPETDELVIYDFGATLKLDQNLITTLQALASGNYKSTVECLSLYADLGFDPQVLQEIANQLPAITEIIFRPLRTPAEGEAPFDFQKWHVGEEVEASLGEQKWLFRSAGPPWFLMVIRSFGSWLHALTELGEPLLVSDCVSLQGASTLWAPLNFTPPKDESPYRLRVNVTTDGKPLVSLEFPVRSLHSLEDLIPDHVTEDLAREGISLAEIKDNALKIGLVPQPLFEKTKGSKTYRVWIE